MTLQTGEIRFGSAVIAYSIARSSRRKTVGITVRPDTSVVVIAPKGMRKGRIAIAVESKAEWVLQQQDDFARFTRPLPRRFASGESFYYLGRQYKLKVRVVLAPSARPRLTFQRGLFTVAMSQAWNAERRATAARKLLVAWFREHAAPWITEKSGRVARKLGVAPTAIRLHDLKGRWASCSDNGTVRFNWRIIMAPPTVVEYVIAHELCHLRHKHHTPAFWRLLARMMPDYEQRRRTLAVMGPRYDF